MAYIEFSKAKAEVVDGGPASLRHRSPNDKRSPENLLHAGWKYLFGYTVDTSDCGFRVPDLDEDCQMVLSPDGEIVKTVKPANNNDQIMYAFNRIPVAYEVDENRKRKIVPGDINQQKVGLCRLTNVTAADEKSFLIGSIHPYYKIPTVLYTRSRGNVRARIGYGNKTREPRSAKHPLARVLNIPAGVIRSKNYNLIPIVFDLDFHPTKDQQHLPNDVDILLNWFLETYFSDGAYSEPSTSGNGRYVIVNLAVHVKAQLEEVKAVLDNFILSAIQNPLRPQTVAKLDGPICNFPTIKTFHKGKLKAILRSQCVRAINFGGHKLNLFRRLRNMQRFALSPTYFVEYFQQDIPTSAILSVTSDRYTQTNTNSLCTPQGGRAKPKSLTFNDQLEAIKSVIDAKERTRRFYGLMNRRENRVLTPDEVQAAYMGYNLHTSENHERRMDLWENQHKFFLQKFKPSSGQFTVSPFVSGGYSKIINVIPEEKRFYMKSKGQGRTSRMKIGSTDLEFAYHVVKDPHDRNGTAFLSFRHLMKLYRSEFGRGCNISHAGAVLHLLVNYGILQVESLGDAGTRRAVHYVPTDSMNAYRQPQTNTNSLCTPHGGVFSTQGRRSGGEVVVTQYLDELLEIGRKNSQRIC